MADFTDIIQEINTNLPDNNTQAITAAKLRTTLIDLVDRIDTVQDDFEEEVSETLIDLVVDNLTSTSTTNALSANQGRILNETIDDVSHSVSDLGNRVTNLVVDNLTTEDATKALSANQGMILNSKIGNIETEVDVPEVTSINGYVRGNTGIIQSSTVSKYANINIEGYKFVNFLGGLLNVIGTSGYAFGYYINDDDSSETNWVTVKSYLYDVDASLTAITTKNYYIEIPDGCKIFRTNSKFGSYWDETDFYCQLIKGDTIDSKIESIENNMLSGVKNIKTILKTDADYIVRQAATTNGTTSSTGNRIKFIFDLSKHDLRNKKFKIKSTNYVIGLWGYKYYRFSNRYGSGLTYERYYTGSYMSEISGVFPDKFEADYIRIMIKKSDDSNFNNTEMTSAINSLVFEISGVEEEIAYEENNFTKSITLPDTIQTSYRTSGPAGPISPATINYYCCCKDYIALPYQSIKFRVVCPDNIKLDIAYGNSGDVTNSKPAVFNGQTIYFNLGITHIIPEFSIVHNGTDAYYDEELSPDYINSLINEGKIKLLYNSDDIIERIKPESSYIENVMDKYKYNDRQNNTPRNFPVFVHASDIHGDITRWENAVKFAAKYNVDAIINTGDNVAHSVTNGMSFVSKVAKKYGAKTLITVGNHDTSDRVNTSFRTNLNENLYNEVIKDFADMTSNNYVLPTSSQYDEAPTYYYSDFTDKKIRFIALNLYETRAYYTGTDDGTYSRISQKQIDWFINTLKSTPQDYGILVGYHRSVAPVRQDTDNTAFWQENSTPGYPPSTWKLVNVNDYPITKIVDAFISRTTLNTSFTQQVFDETFTTTITETININADFSTGIATGVEFIAHLFGHHHRDTVGYYYHPTGETALTNLQLVLDVCQTTSKYSDTYVSWANPSDLSRGYGDTISQDAFNVYSIDRATKTVRIAKVGSNLSSETLIPRQYMTIKYAL